MGMGRRGKERRKEGRDGGQGRGKNPCYQMVPLDNKLCRLHSIVLLLRLQKENEARMHIQRDDKLCVNVKIHD